MALFSEFGWSIIVLIILNWPFISIWIPLDEEPEVLINEHDSIDAILVIDSILRPEFEKLLEVKSIIV